MITNPVGNRLFPFETNRHAATDHHTRVVTGGSALPPDSTVCGLLYGYYDDPSLGERRGVSVVDSEEMEYPGTAAVGVMAGEGGAHAAILQRVGLHQTIFPKHKVSCREDIWTPRTPRDFTTFDCIVTKRNASNDTRREFIRNSGSRHN